jgi:methionyl-tRNA formyltransferase
MPIKIIFFGTPDLSVPFLEALTNESDFEVAAVVTRPDQPVGRKQILTPPPVKELALKKNIEVFQPKSLRLEARGSRQETDPPPGLCLPALASIGADLFIVVAYGKIIPQTVLDMPRLGCLNVHPSLLPKYRGPSPIQSAIANGDNETGLSIMLLDKGMDSGPILAQTKFPLAADETQITLTEKIKEIGPAFLIGTIKKFAAGKIKPVPQDNSQATVCKILNRDSGKIDWSEPAETIERKIRAYYPWPGSWTEIEHGGKTLRVKILKASLREKRLIFLEVQPEGQRPMEYEEFVRGYGHLKTAQ